MVYAKAFPKWWYFLGVAGRAWGVLLSLVVRGQKAQICALREGLGRGTFMVMPVDMSKILQLPVSDRVKLVQSIWDSIAEIPEAVELTETQRQELDRRLEAYERNPDAGSPWSEVKARILSGQ